MKNHKDSHAEESAGENALHRPAPTHRVLLVDDDPDLRLQSAEVLFRSGYQVDTADDGAAGWEALQTSTYDLLITDNKMPKVSGVDLVKKLRSARMELPVILASSAMPEELSRLPWLKLAATLLKPFTANELLGTVRQALRAPEAAQERTEPLPTWRNQPSALDIGRR